MARGSSRLSAARSVEELQQLVSGELDLLVAPLRGAVVAGDQAGAVQATEIAVDECVACLGPVRGALGEAEVPFGVIAPGVRLEERVFVRSFGLDVSPVAVQHVLPSADEPPRPRDRSFIHGVDRHEQILAETVSRRCVDARERRRPPAALASVFRTGSAYHIASPR